MLKWRVEWQSKNDVFVILPKIILLGLEESIQRMEELPQVWIEHPACTNHCLAAAAPFVAELDPYKEVILWWNQQQPRLTMQWETLEWIWFLVAVKENIKTTNHQCYVKTHYKHCLLSINTDLHSPGHPLFFLFG